MKSRARTCTSTTRATVVATQSPGNGGHHGQQHEFQIRTRDAEHPITQGLPAVWMHTKDELYDSLRGPAEGHAHPGHRLLRARNSAAPAATSRC